MEIGYSLVGFAPADDFEEFIAEALKRQADYDWWLDGPRKPLEQARPTNIMAQAKSLIVLAYNSAQVHFPKHLSSLMGRIYQARCYFAPPANINGARLGLLQAFLANEGIASENALWLPQRWAGLRAGLTSFGKNTFAYAPRLGSFIVLTTLVVDATLDPDEPSPVASTCPEDCRRCIDACPTGALAAPYQLVPRRCISFNNWMPQVQSIPEEIRPLLGSRIHGCDACQEACPKNAAVLKANDTRPRDSLLELLDEELTLEQILHMPDGYYESRIKPVMYNYIRNPQLFRRNAAVAMGNSGDPRYLPHLEQHANDTDPLVREHVAWAISRINGS
ncbi:MAG: hypothetical protein LBR39_06535 [Coriobacteriales bacterium]|nr:hypothetical protein [Coriobacteriales bacterium]